MLGVACGASGRTGRPQQTHSNLDLTFQVEDARAFQLDAIARQPANDLSTASRGLEGTKHCLALSFGPVRRQHAMRAAGHRIFRDALGWGEVTANEVIAFIPRSGHNHAIAIHAGERCYIGSKLTYDLRTLEQAM